MKAPPLPIALLALSQAVFGLFVVAGLAYFLATSGFVGIGEVPAWALPVGCLAALSCVASAVQLWRLKWSGPISFLVLWLLPFVGSLPFATVAEIIRDASYIEGRLSFLLVYAVIVFEFRGLFAPVSSLRSKPLGDSTQLER